MLSNIIKDRKLSGKQKGFTIIEVMIVLAVAALIILIVLLAVPALQRSSRNTSIKNDAATVASSVSNYETNNNGLVPGYVQNATAGTADGTVLVGKAAGDTNNESVKIQGSTIVWPILASSGTKPVAAATSATGASGSLAPGQIQSWAGHTCDGTVSNRAVSIYYVTENGGSNQLQCIDT